MELGEYWVVVAKIQPMLDALMGRTQSAWVCCQGKSIFYATCFLRVLVISICSFISLSIAGHNVLQVNSQNVEKPGPTTNTLQVHLCTYVYGFVFKC